MTKQELFAKVPPYDAALVQKNLEAELAKSRAKVIALDDDPTGVQTVHDVYVYTDWSRESVRAGVADGNRLFFILTNSRAFDSATTRRAHRQMAENILAEAEEFILVSRGDSTLRGHWPLETETLREALEAGGQRIDGEVICPFFPEGGRYTADNIHYVASGDALVPAGETEFARDKTFGYRSSDLTRWVEEKTGGRYKAAGVTCISLEELRALDYEGITAKLCAVQGFGKVVVNAIAYEDVMVFATAFYRALAAGKRFLLRSAAALVRVLGGVSPQPVLDAAALRQHGNRNGGLIIIGSHVSKTTAQLEALRSRADITFIEMDQHLVVDPPAFEREAARVLALARENVAAGNTVAVYTRRERFDLNTGNKEDELRCAAEISDKLTGVVSGLGLKPSFIIGKGGITSSDVGTKGLLVKRALVLGQILPGVPVWLIGEESRYPGMPYVIFPGNVGDENALLEAVGKFKD